METVNTETNDVNVTDNSLQIPEKFRLSSIKTINFYSKTICQLINPDDNSVVQYNLDEMDCKWLDNYNQQFRDKVRLERISYCLMEILLDALERFSKEIKSDVLMRLLQSKSGQIATSHPTMFEQDSFEPRLKRFLSGNSIGQSTTENDLSMISSDENTAQCVICGETDSTDANQIIFCETCHIAVHQDCYGVFVFPTGPWNCRKCQYYGKKYVKTNCALCPNYFGAYKKCVTTERNKVSWAHVSCALWLPEVKFGSTIFLEPIQELDKIPKLRLKLKCYLCKKAFAGASLQCDKHGCYRAFHVTCAQIHGLYLKMDTIVTERDDDGCPTDIKVDKKAFCGYCSQLIPNYEMKPLVINERNERLNESVSSHLSDDSVYQPPDLNQLHQFPILEKRIFVALQSRLWHVKHRYRFLQHIIAYWIQKRFINGITLPLDTRQFPNLKFNDSYEIYSTNSVTEDQSFFTNAKENLLYLKTIRADLEKSRLLIELIKKREKLKNQMIKNRQQISLYQTFPLFQFLSDFFKDFKNKIIIALKLPEIETEKIEEKLSQFRYRTLIDLIYDIYHELELSSCPKIPNTNNTPLRQSSRSRQKSPKSSLTTNNSFSSLDDTLYPNLNLFFSNAASKLDQIGINYNTGQHSKIKKGNNSFIINSILSNYSVGKIRQDLPKMKVNETMPYYESLNYVNLCLERARTCKKIDGNRISDLTKEKMLMVRKIKEVAFLPVIVDED